MDMPTRFFRKLVALVLAAAQLAACTTLVPVGDKPGDLRLAPGERVAVTTRGGETREFDVLRASEAEICSASECLKAADIVLVEVREASVGRTLLLVGAILVVIFAGIAASGSFAFMPGPPVL